MTALILLLIVILSFAAQGYRDNGLAGAFTYVSVFAIVSAGIGSLAYYGLGYWTENTPSSFEAKVISVEDGNNLKVQLLDTDKMVKVRLFDVTAPQICEPHGKESMAILQKEVIGKIVSIVRHDGFLTDTIIGSVFTNGGNHDVNEAMLKKGAGWYSGQDIGDVHDYKKSMSYAKQKKRGIWKIKGFTPPSGDSEKLRPVCESSEIKGI